VKQLDFLEIVQKTSFDFKHHPDPEMVFGDLKVGDWFQIITWVSGEWHTISEVFVRVDQSDVSFPNSIALERDRRYPYRLATTSFFKDVPVRLVIKSA
jgi:hypothetical protein